MTLQKAIEWFGSESAFARALQMNPRQIKRIETDAQGQLLDRRLMDRILAAMVRHQAAAKRLKGELDPLEADLTTI